MSPLLLHGNNVIRDPLGPEFYLYGRPWPDGDEGDVKVNVMATWFLRQPDDTVERHLVDAARQYTAGRFDAVVVPANIAAEAALSPVVAKVFEGFAGRENLDRFLRDAATYSHQLNVLLAVVAELLPAPKFPDEIRGVLNRLRRLRNDIAHDGTCASQSQGDAAEHIAAAIFLVQYATLLRKKLSERMAIP
ncbi:MAG: hypothetical protein HYZ29_01020 [Myxococcales bacterium]|nr:hypothetical protein [Myxococcales bacterium]